MGGISESHAKLPPPGRLFGGGAVFRKNPVQTTCKFPQMFAHMCVASLSSWTEFICYYQKVCCKDIQIDTVLTRARDYLMTTSIPDFTVQHRNTFNLY